jgi:hypothetical protein
VTPDNHRNHPHTLTSIQLKNDIEPATKMKREQSLTCSFCKKEYKHRQSLQRHIKSNHEGDTEETGGNMKCLEEGCAFSCKFTRQLQKHLTEEHQKDFEMKNEIFSTMSGISFCMLPLKCYMYIHVF